MEAKVLFQANHLLGEGLFYDCVGEKLWGVDIEGFKIWAIDLSTLLVTEFPTADKVGWCFPLENSPLWITGQGTKIVILDLTRSIEVFVKFVPGLYQSICRLNDAVVDSRGRIWMGSKCDSSESSDCSGALYCIELDGTVEVKDVGYEIANGPVISPDGAYLLHTDSSKRLIYIFDFDLDSGEITNKRIWKKFTSSDGEPDGMCFDTAGSLWVAHWGAGRVVKYDVDGCEIDSVTFPVSQVTNICFGGKNLDRLFVSSAKVGLSERQLKDELLAGSIFEITGHLSKGLPSHRPSPHFIF
jgi:D-xylonolactonase